MASTLFITFKNFYRLNKGEMYDNFRRNRKFIACDLARKLPSFISCDIELQYLIPYSSASIMYRWHPLSLAYCLIYRILSVRLFWSPPCSPFPHTSSSLLDMSDISERWRQVMTCIRTPAKESRMTETNNGIIIRSRHDNVHVGIDKELLDWKCEI